ncbi:MAG TPA: hypothetical protein VF145_10560 [Chitinophagaceae bacterium]
MPQQEPLYSIPISYRRMENLHIFFWLFKDVSWCMEWKLLGMAMIFPTLIVAIVIAVRTRQIVSELCHNVAIIFWITANSYWMIAEFFGFDEQEAMAGIEWRYVAVIPFSIGIIVMLYYYLYWKPAHKGELETL